MGRRHPTTKNAKQMNTCPTCGQPSNDRFDPPPQRKILSLMHLIIVLIAFYTILFTLIYAIFWATVGGRV